MLYVKTITQCVFKLNSRILSHTFYSKATLY